MHIPACESCELDILSFEEALRASGGRGDYDTCKWLYVPDHYADYRYILGTRGENPLICIGINPSTAQPGDLDNTLKSVERIALGNGYDSFGQRLRQLDNVQRLCPEGHKSRRHGQGA